ncbi:MAG: SDR family oxidoreductase [Chloroflexota bacterium]
MTVLDLFKLENKRVFITGGSRGLGRAMALAMAEAGADVILTGRTAASLEATAREVRARGRASWTNQADMADPEVCAQACMMALRDIGDIDILVNNVGGRRLSIPIEETSVEQWQQFVDLNLTHVFLCTKIIGGAMLQRRQGGRVINIASISGMIANRGIAGRHYETAKAAVIQFTRAIAADWAPQGITVNAICPGFFMTEPNRAWARTVPEVMDTFLENIPMGRAGDPDEIGPLAVYLASDASAYVTGASFVIDGGYTLW